MTPPPIPWQMVLDPQLLQRLHRPVQRLGVSRYQLANRIIERSEQGCQRLPLLEQQLQRWATVVDADAEPVPLVYAQGQSGDHLNPEHEIRQPEPQKTGASIGRKNREPQPKFATEHYHPTAQQTISPIARNTLAASSLSLSRPNLEATVPVTEPTDSLAPLRAVSLSLLSRSQDFVPPGAIAVGATSPPPMPKLHLSGPDHPNLVTEPPGPEVPHRFPQVHHSHPTATLSVPAATATLSLAVQPGWPHSHQTPAIADISGQGTGNHSAAPSPTILQSPNLASSAPPVIQRKADPSQPAIAPVVDSFSRLPALPQVATALTSRPPLSPLAAALNPLPVPTDVASAQSPALPPVAPFLPRLPAQTPLAMSPSQSDENLTQDNLELVKPIPAQPELSYSFLDEAEAIALPHQEPIQVSQSRPLSASSFPLISPHSTLTGFLDETTVSTFTASRFGAVGATPAVEPSSSDEIATTVNQSLTNLPRTTVLGVPEPFPIQSELLLPSLTESVIQAKPDPTASTSGVTRTLPAVETTGGPTSGVTISPSHTVSTLPLLEQSWERTSASPRSPTPLHHSSQPPAAIQASAMPFTASSQVTATSPAVALPFTAIAQAEVTSSLFPPTPEPVSGEDNLPVVPVQMFRDLSSQPLELPPQSSMPPIVDRSETPATTPRKPAPLVPLQATPNSRKLGRILRQETAALQLNPFPIVEVEAEQPSAPMEPLPISAPHAIIAQANSVDPTASSPHRLGIGATTQTTHHQTVRVLDSSSPASARSPAPVATVSSERQAPAPTMPALDMDAIVDQMERKLMRRIVVESERRGQKKWH